LVAVDIPNANHLTGRLMAVIAQEEREMTRGGALGASGGAILGAIGGNAGLGALAGGVAGAAVGGLTSPHAVNAGPSPVCL
jgi:hypothetical protein